MEDPLPISSSLEQSAAGATFKLQNIALTGLRTYEVPQVHVDLTTHEVSVEQSFTSHVTYDRESTRIRKNSYLYFISHSTLVKTTPQNTVTARTMGRC